MRTIRTLFVALALPLVSSTVASAQNTPRFYGNDFPVSMPGMSAVTLADMNGDGKLDCIVSAPYSTAVIVHSGDGTGRFTQSSTTSVGRYPTVLRVADVNRDGRPDIITLNPTDNTLSVRLNNGAGSYTGSNLTFPYYSARDVNIADVTGDGNPDYLVSHVGDGVVVYVGDGAGGFTWAGPGVLGTWFNFAYGTVTPADMNNDGKLDLLSTAFNGVELRLGNGDGTFGPIAVVPVPATPVQNICVGDFNGDGRQDIVAVEGNDQKLYLRLQTATGTYEPGAEITTVRSPYPVRVGDFNGDGKQDLAVGSDDSQYTGVAAGPFIELFYGAGNGTFSAGEFAPVGAETSDLAVGDIDQDGRLDFVAGNYNNTYSVRLNSLLPTNLNLAASTPGSYNRVLNQIQWKPGSATERVVFIREVRPGRAPLAQPVDGIAYLVNQQEMNSTSRVAPGTYTLGKAVAGDSIALLRNGAIGHVYEVGIFEYKVDPVNGPMYRRDERVQYTFTASRFAPVLQATLTNDVPVLSWDVAAQYKAQTFQVQSSRDGVNYSPIGSSVAAMDSASTAQSYSQTGQAPQAGRAYYRVQMNHADGTVLYSNAVALGQAPLPVELVRFSGRVGADNRATLSWATASERNSAYFAVERSTDGSRFSVVGRVKAAGTSSQQRAYSLTDSEPVGSKAYYRLHQVDTDSSNTYSAVVTLTANAQRQQLTVWPNPASKDQVATLRLSGLPQQTGTVSVSIRSVTGKLVQQQQLSPAQATDWSWSLSDYAKGLYLVEVQSNAGRQITRLVVE